MLRKLKTRHKILLGFSVPILLMLGMAFVVHINTLTLVETSNWVEHTHHAIADAQELGKLIVDMETGERGFLITGKEEFLSPYIESIGLWDDRIKHLKNLVSDNPEQVLRIEVIDDFAKNWLKVAAQPVIAARIESKKTGASMDKVIALISAKTGKNIIDSIRVKLDEFIKVEEDLMGIRDLKAKNAASNTIIVTMLGTAFAILFALFSSLLVSTKIAGGLKELVEKTEEISKGTFTSKVNVENDDEIGILARAFNDMTQQLSEREDDLRQSEEQQRTLIFNIPGAVYRCACDNDWTMEYISDFIEEISGYLASDFIDNKVRTFNSIIHPDDSHVVRKITLDALERKEPYETEYRIVHADGTIRWVYEKGRGEFGANDEVLWLDGAIFNVSERKIMEEELERLATIDGLTDIANRRYFDVTLKKEWMRLARTKKPLSMIMCDIDYFKNYNDTYGHQCGDEALKQVSKVLKNISKRSIDLPARYGGEEFAIILPETDGKAAKFLANSLLVEVESLGIEHKKSKVSEFVTISVGVASIIPDQKTSPNKLIAHADSALYDAKRTGRNRVDFVNLIIDYIGKNQ